ncbi:amino acid ABC transporter substrate-binding protein [Tissierella sp. MB52-C2]|uniref:amino acid ABC transporter substrate-binding protein n=1 Tax=Tissierella sp. MB52-C2 TaxID=3070999 RepID=UPI00280AA85C|nr:amino acid ABC transporter substrate-binding protein [Tissierella sp. MB52-C2]WMM24828.1 amino acid ABC transporter substrate-binding protein [Tissierella sp. MB52-C2]
MKKLKFLVISVVALSLILSGCGAKDKVVDAWSKIEERGSIIVGLDDTFVPMGFRDKAGNLTGFDVELAKEAASRMGLKIEFQPIDWNLKEQELDSGNIDLIWNGYSISEERLKKVNFTKPYLDNRQVIVALNSSDINTKEDLKNRIVATQNSSSSLEALEKSGAIEDFKNAEAILFDTYNEAFMDLEAGRVEAVVADQVLARYYIAERGEEKYKVLDDDFGDEEYGVGLRLGDKVLLERLNKALDEMKEDDTAKAISEKWFGENIIK